MTERPSDSTLIFLAPTAARYAIAWVVVALALAVASVVLAASA